MLSRSKAKRAVMAAVVAAAVGASGAATADAATVTRTDDTAADFTAGTQNGTIVRGTDAAAGVEIARTLESSVRRRRSRPADRLDVDAAGTAGGRRDGRRRRADRRRRARRHRRDRRSRELGRVPRRRSATEPFRHVGFGGRLRRDAVGDVQHRRRTAGGRAVRAHVRRRRSGCGCRHRARRRDATARTMFRIDWTATGFDLLRRRRCGRDPGVRARRPAARPAASDFDLDGRRRLGRRRATLRARTTGTFVSRVLDAGDPKVTAATLTPTAVTPTGTTSTYRTRTADTAAGLTAAPWTARSPRAARSRTRSSSSSTRRRWRRRTRRSRRGSTRSTSRSRPTPTHPR